MSRELMIVEHTDFLQKEGLDAPAALREVYHCYGFSLPEYIPDEGQTLIVAAQLGDSEPEPISRNDYLSDVLDPVRGKAARVRNGRLNLRKFRLLRNMLVFVFEPVS